jgi:hypothetical protein
MSKMLSRLFLFPNKGANQTSSTKKAWESMANDKNPPPPTFYAHQSSRTLYLEKNGRSILPTYSA